MGNISLVVYNCFICRNWSINDAPTWRHFACSLKKKDVGSCVKLTRVRESWLFAESAWLKGECSPPFSRTDTLPFPPCFQPTTHSPLLWKASRRNPRPLFQTAWKTTSCRCIVVAGPVSANKTNVHYCLRPVTLNHSSRDQKCSPKHLLIYPNKSTFLIQRCFKF